MLSFVVIGAGAVLKSAIKNITENNGIIKIIYVDNPTDTQRYINSYKVKDSSDLNNDIDYLKNNVDKCTWLISVDNKKIITSEVLLLFQDRAINFHPGILPYYKGLYCYQWAVFNGESKFAATIHFIEPEVDTGDIVIEKAFSIEQNDTGLNVYQKSIKYGIQGINEVLTSIFNKIELSRVPQKYGTKNIYQRASPFEMEIDWQKPSDQILNSLRACNFYPLVPPAFQMCYMGIPVSRGKNLTIKTSDKPGTVLNVSENKMQIATGDQAVIEITLATKGSNYENKI